MDDNNDHLLKWLGNQLADQIEGDKEASVEQLCLLSIVYSLGVISEQLQRLNATLIEIKDDMK